MQEIFLSYSRHDSSSARSLAAALTEKGRSVWFDRHDLEEGDAYDTQIEEAIAQTRIVIVIWSKHSIKSHWVRAEAAYALSKRKLLPISIDKSQPPLQFLHIQTLDFQNWNGDINSNAFQHLAATVGRRLDPVVAGSGDNIEAPTKLATSPNVLPKGDIDRNKVASKFAEFLVAVGLRFPERVIEQEFRGYFRERNFIVAQFAILLAFLTYVIYGVADMASDTAILSTRFRYMAACPLMLMFFGASFTKFARRHFQPSLATFGATASACVYVTVILIGIETPFRLETGNGTMNFMLVLAFIALLPLSVTNTLLVGAFVNLLHALVMVRTQLPLSATWLNYLHIASIWTVASCIAYWRERLQRLSFASGFS